MTEQKIEQLARELNALAFDAAETPDWEDAAVTFGECRDALRVLNQENAKVKALLNKCRLAFAGYIDPVQVWHEVDKQQGDFHDPA